MTQPATYYLKPLALDFAGHETIEKKKLHRHSSWKKMMKLTTIQRYEIVLIAFRGLLQKKNPGYDNQLWRMLVTHDLAYMLNKGNKQFLYEVSEEIKKVTDIDSLPFDICWKVVLGLKKHGFDSCLSVLLQDMFKKHGTLETVSAAFQEFMAKIETEFQNVSKSTSEELQKEVYRLHNSFALAEEKPPGSKWGKYFVDGPEGEEAWHRLDNGTKKVLRQYENDLFYDRSPRPSQKQKDASIEAVQNSKLNKKHKKAIIDSIKKKG